MAALVDGECVAAAPLRELASGIDAFYLSMNPDVPDELLGRLEAAKAAAVEAQGALPFEFGSAEFLVEPTSFGRYRYCLSHRHARLGISARKSKMPSVRVQPRAEFLHAVTPAVAVDQLSRIVSEECGPVHPTVSRVDLFADFQGWALGGDDRDAFVCRGRSRVLYEDGDEFGGLQFGNRRSQTLTGRIYDKTREVAKKGNDYWFDVWGERFRRGSPVLRVEFEFGRGSLRDFTLLTPGEVFNAVGALWAYATDEWVSCRVVTADCTRSRWPLAREWEDVQRATLRQNAVGLSRVRAGLKAGTIRTLLPALVGYLATSAAALDCVTFEALAGFLPGLLRDYEQISGVSFEQRVMTKRLERRL